MKREFHIDPHRVASYLWLVLPPISFILWFIAIFLPAVRPPFS